MKASKRKKLLNQENLSLAWRAYQILFDGNSSAGDLMMSTKCILNLNNLQVTSRR